MTKTVRDRIRLRRVSRNQPVDGTSVGCIGHRQGQGQRNDCEAGDRQPRPIKSEERDQGQAQQWLQDHHRQCGNQRSAEDGVTRPPGDWPGRTEMVGGRAERQHHTDHRQSDDEGQDAQQAGRREGRLPRPARSRAGPVKIG